MWNGQQENAMFNRRIALLAVALAASVPAWSQSSLTIDTAPPAARIETPGPVREGYVWAPGYWGYESDRYTWVEGRYLEARPGRRYVAPRWEQSGGRWTLYPEQWVSDEDAKDKRGGDARQWEPGRR
jgi:hypothetical protein